MKCKENAVDCSSVQCTVLNASNDNPTFSCAFKLSYTSGIYVNSHFYSRFRYVSERPTKDQNLSLNISASAKHYMFDSFTILIKQEKEFIEEFFPNMW